MKHAINRDRMKWRIGQIKYGIVLFAKKAYASNRRKHIARQWRNRISERLDKGHCVSHAQRQQVLEYFNTNTRLRVDTLFHEFYTQKTHLFDLRYIPDDIYYAYIDPYYNDWAIASHLDNKCYYYKIFEGINQPETIAMRMGSTWLVPLEKEDSRYLFVDENVAFSRIAACESFMKQATESEGGHGVIYLPNNSNIDEIRAAVNRLNGDLIIQKKVKQVKLL